jgi:putative hydrolase of the HAD superfamily
VLSVPALQHAEHVVVRELDTPEGTQTDARRWDRFMARVLEQAGAPLDAVAKAVRVLRQEHDRTNLWSHVPPDVPAALSDLRSLGFRLGVVSNANGLVRAALKRAGLARFLDLVVDSHEEGVEKPDPEIFRRALVRMGLAAGDALFVGDVFHIDVQGARAAGLRPVLLDRAGLSSDRDVERVGDLAELTVRLRLLVAAQGSSPGYSTRSR